MMFLVRSAFWLGIVYSSMPLDRGEALRAVDQAQGAIVAERGRRRQGQMRDGYGVLPRDRQPPPARPRRAARRTPAHVQRGAARSWQGREDRKPSADTLSAADLATPWRGRAGPESGA